MSSESSAKETQGSMTLDQQKKQAIAGDELGVRRLGSSLLSMEKKMKERQRLFRKQQLQVEEQKAYQQQAVAATSAQHELGDVLISHNSSHDSKQETTHTVLESVEESAEKNI